MTYIYTYTHTYIYKYIYIYIYIYIIYIKLILKISHGDTYNAERKKQTRETERYREKKSKWGGRVGEDNKDKRLGFFWETEIEKKKMTEIENSLIERKTGRCEERQRKKVNMQTYFYQSTNQETALAVFSGYIFTLWSCLSA